jgi:hypothetical protein
MGSRLARFNLRVLNKGGRKYPEKLKTELRKTGAMEKISQLCFLIPRVTVHWE